MTDLQRVFGHQIGPRHGLVSTPFETSSVPGASRRLSTRSLGPTKHRSSCATIVQGNGRSTPTPDSLTTRLPAQLKPEPASRIPCTISHRLAFRAKGSKSSLTTGHWRPYCPPTPGRPSEQDWETSISIASASLSVASSLSELSGKMFTRPWHSKRLRWG